MFQHKRRLAFLFVLLFLVVACLIYILNDRQVNHVHQLQLDGARFQKSGAYHNTRSSSSGNPIVQTFNYLPWTSLGKQKHYLPWTSLGKQKQNDIVKVKVKPILSQATVTTITPLLELELGLESSSSSLIKGTDVPFVVLSGPSVFSVDNITTVTTNQSSSSRYYRLVFPERMDSGNYEMHIIFYMDKTPYAIPGSPFEVVVQDDKYDTSMATIMNDDDDDADTPYCNAAFPSSQVPGRWIRATPQELATGTSPRDGWIWKPFECHFHMQPTRTLPCGEPLWVAVFGTSTIRGVFFELLDTILPESQSANTIANVAWWKCWGYLDASVQHFRFSYRDFRLGYPDSRLSPGYKELALHWLHQNVCPRHLNGTAGAAWANTTRGQWTKIDVIVAESDDLLRSFAPGCVEEFEAAGGTFIGASLKPRSPSLEKLATGRLVSQQHEEQGRPFLDVAPMARPMYNNGRKTGMATDIHYIHNGFCRFNHRTKHICSGVVEMEVFVILHTIRQLRPSWAKSLDSATANTNCVAAAANKPALDSEEPDTTLKLQQEQQEEQQQQEQHNDVVLQPTICMQCPLNFKYLDTQPIKCTEGIPLECLGHRRKKHWWQTIVGTGGKACFSNT